MSTRHTVKEWMSQGQDGEPHLTLFIAERGEELSFVWDLTSPVINFSHGGYGEPTIGIFPADIDIVQVVKKAADQGMSAGVALAQEFEIRCRSFTNILSHVRFDEED